MGDGLLHKTPLRDENPDNGAAAGEKEPPKKNKTKKMLGLFIGAIFLLSALIYGLVGYSSGDIAVPDVKGKTLVEAEAILKDNNLDFTLKEEFDAKVPTGTVIKQSPGAGSHVKAGRKIQLTVSKGAEPGVVPDLKGKNLAEATEMLHAAKLAVGKVTVQYKEGLLKEPYSVRISKPGRKWLLEPKWTWWSISPRDRASYRTLRALPFRMPGNGCLPWALCRQCHDQGRQRP